MIALICEICGETFELNRAFLNGFVPEICPKCKRKQRPSALDS